jgi:hypothetical protein
MLDTRGERAYSTLLDLFFLTVTFFSRYFAIAILVVCLECPTIDVDGG